MSLNGNETCSSCGADMSLDEHGLENVCPKCLLIDIFKNDTSPGEELEQRFENYELIEKIGEGGMGAVYSAVQLNLDRNVALKIVSDRGDIHPDSRDRIIREAKAMAFLNHPNIVSVHDCGESESGEQFIVMEYVEGTSLQQILTDEAKIDKKRLIRWLQQICSALDYAHSKGIVHRDIKPSNILIDTDDQVKVTDFGLAKFVDLNSVSLVTATNQAVGTAFFAAPEQLDQNAEIDARADLYSFGVLLYLILTNRLPQGAWELPSKTNPEIDPRFDPIVSKALQFDPDERFESSLEIFDLLGTIQTVQALPERPHSRKTFVTILVAFASITLAYFLIDFFNREVVKPTTADGTDSTETAATPPLEKLPSRNEVTLATFPDDKKITVIFPDHERTNFVAVDEFGAPQWIPFDDKIPIRYQKPRGDLWASAWSSAHPTTEFFRTDDEIKTIKIRHKTRPGRSIIGNLYNRTVRFTDNDLSYSYYERDVPTPARATSMPAPGIYPTGAWKTANGIDFVAAFYRKTPPSPEDPKTGLKSYNLNRPGPQKNIITSELGFDKATWLASTFDLLLARAGDERHEILLLNTESVEDISVRATIPTNAPTRLIRFFGIRSPDSFIHIEENRPDRLTVMNLNGVTLLEVGIQKLSEITAVCGLSKGDWILCAGPRRDGEGHAIIAVETKIGL